MKWEGKQKTVTITYGCADIRVNMTDVPEESPVTLPDDLSLELGFDLIPLVEKDKGAELLERVQGVRRQMTLDLGLVIPKVHIIDNSLLEKSEYRIMIKGVDMGRGKIRHDNSKTIKHILWHGGIFITMGYFLCINPGTVTSEIKGEKTVDPAFGLPALWVHADRLDEAKRAGYTVADSPSVIATHLTEIIRRHSADLLGLQNTHDILETIYNDYPAVVSEVLHAGLRVAEIQKVLQGLLKEQVSIRNMVSILESIAYNARISSDILFLTERARQALANQICRQYADKDNCMHVLTIDPALEQKIIESKAATSSGIACILDPPTHSKWIKAVGKAVATVVEKGWMPVILCHGQARFLVKYSTSRELPELAILSVEEIADGFTVESVGEIRIDDK